MEVYKALPGVNHSSAHTAYTSWWSVQFAIKTAINEPDLASTLQILYFKADLSGPLYLFVKHVVKEEKWFIFTHDTAQTGVTSW